MQRKILLALLALAICLAVCVGIPLSLRGHRSSPVTVRYAKSILWGRPILASFEYTNHTTSVYGLNLVAVEFREGPVWKSCFYRGPVSAPANRWSCVYPGCLLKQDYVLRDLPKTAAIRVRYEIFRYLPGLKGLYRRFELRFRSGERQVDLNPFSKSEVYSKPIEIVSDVFTEPELRSSQQMTAGR